MIGNRTIIEVQHVRRDKVSLAAVAPHPITKHQVSGTYRDTAHDPTLLVTRQQLFIRHVLDSAASYVSFNVSFRKMALDSVCISLTAVQKTNALNSTRLLLMG